MRSNTLMFLCVSSSKGLFILVFGTLFDRKVCTSHYSTLFKLPAHLTKGKSVLDSHVDSREKVINLKNE